MCVRIAKAFFNGSLNEVNNSDHFEFWKKHNVGEGIVVYASTWKSKDGEEHLKYDRVENMKYFGERDSMPLSDVDKRKKKTGERDSMPLSDVDKRKKKKKKN